MPIREMVYIIGSGNRIENNFLPVLSHLSEHYQCIGLHSRNERTGKKLCEKWDIKFCKDLVSNELIECSTIIISITTHNVPSVLRAIRKFVQGKRLVLDTPIFSSVLSFYNSYFLRNFEKVVVAEDYAQFPQFSLLRQILFENEKIEVKKIAIFNTGYQYHGLALGRGFLNYSRPVAFETVVLNGVSLYFEFENKVEFHLIEPYQRLDGTIEITTDQKEYIFSSKYLSNRPNAVQIYHVETEDDFSFNISEPHFLLEDKLLFDMKYFQSLDISDRSIFNSLKCVGLSRLLNPNHESEYSLKEALFDSLLSKFIWCGWSLKKYQSKVILLIVNVIVAISLKLAKK